LGGNHGGSIQLGTVYCRDCTFFPVLHVYPSLAQAVVHFAGGEVIVAMNRALRMLLSIALIVTAQCMALGQASVPLAPSFQPLPGGPAPLLGGTARPLAEVGPVPNSKLVFAHGEDASLHALGVVSEDRICAVGDRGAILFTDNAGHSWQLLPPITTCNLYGVAFRGHVGIAVGGLVGKRVGVSQGVVLRTEDGGKSWQVASSGPLSRLCGVQYSADRWLAWGDYNPVLQASVVESFDEGQTWRAVAGDIGHAVAAAWTRPDNGLVVDSLGRCLRTSLKLAQEAISANLTIHQVMHDGQRWWACGSHGTCLVSNDGFTWQEVPLPLTPAARDCIDFKRLIQQEDTIWLVGSPGSILLLSRDRGKTWQRIETGQFLPIHDLQFLDRNRGWMVGAQGMIWATRDGGLSWFSQRRRGQRIGLLAIVERAEQLPWSPLIAAIWEEQLTAATLAMSHGEPLDKANFVVDPETAVACLAPQVGLADHSAWSMPAVDASQATRRLAVALRTWRPDVVLSDERQWATAASVAPHRVDWTAVARLASTADADFAIGKELFLPAWSVSKLAAATEDVLGEYSENNSRVLKSLGLTIWDVMFHLPVAGLRADSSIAMRTLWSRSQASVVRSSLMGGVARSPEVVRPPLEHALGNYQLVMGRIHRQRSLEQLVEQPQLTTSAERWREEFHFLLKTLPDAEIGWLLEEQARHALRLGRFDRHRMLLEAIVQRRPSEDTAEWARWELLRLSSSAEFQAWQNAVEMLKSPADVQAAGGGVAASSLLAKASPFDEPVVAVATGTELARALHVVPASATQSMPFSEADAANRAVSQIDWEPAGVGAGEDNSRELPQLGANMELGVSLPSGEKAPPSLQAAQWLRQMGESTTRTAYTLSRPDCKLLFGKNLAEAGTPQGQQLQYDSLLQQSWMIGWCRAARQESFIKANRVADLKWVAFADLAHQPPVLDGRLDEACWSRVPRMRLQGFEEPGEDSIRQPATIAWAYDRNYLYVGLECPRPSGRRVPLATNRIYDADLRQLDHCLLVLDTDRDYSTAIELSIAENGQTQDSCCGYSSYNPRWHVSVDSQPDRWSAEVAIPLVALTGKSTITGQAWGVSAYRYMPSGKMESWSQLKTHRPSLEANGLLLFVPNL
jgi:photosystem II stability/assembly factor-like uncharacterized protein